MVWMNIDNAFTTSPNCYKRDRDIFIKLSTQPYTLGIATKFKLNGVIRSPSLAG